MLVQTSLAFLEMQSSFHPVTVLLFTYEIPIIKAAAMLP
jgi:hypothetical protein